MSLAAHVQLTRGTFTLDVALAVGDGQVLAVLGPNGAGKSTLLRAVAGLQPLTAGRISVGDVVWDEPATGAWTPPQRRRVGVVFQDYRLFPHLSALENIAFGPRSAGTPRAGAREAARAWLQRLGLGGMEDRRPAQLSGGQAQRVALARALATEPDVLVLDEPLAALDVGTRDDVRGQLRAQLAAFTGSVLLVTHDLLDALTLADRVLVLADGRAVQEDSPDDLLRRPAHPYVAQLAGLNLWSGSVRAGRLALAGAPDDVGVAVPGPVAPGSVLITCSPGQVALRRPGPPGAAPSPGPGQLSWSVTVRSVQRLVERVRVRLEGPPDALADLDLATAAGLSLEPGRVLAASVDVTHLSVRPAPPPPPS